MYYKSFSKSPFSAILHAFFLLIFSTIALSATAQNSTPHSDATDAEFGYVMFSTEADSFFVVVNGDFNDPKFIESADTDNLKLETGTNYLTLIKPYHFDFNVNTDITADSTQTLDVNLRKFRDNERNKYSSSYPRLAWGGRVMVQSDSDTELFINGESAGLGMVVLNEPDSYEISGKSFDGTTFRRTLEVTDDPEFEIIDFYYRPDRRRAIEFSFIPGASQIYKRQRLKAGLFIGLTTTTIALALNERRKFIDADNRYAETGLDYVFETNPRRTLMLGNRLEELDVERNRYLRNRNRFFAGLAAVYVVNVIDGLRRPRMGFREGVTFDPYLDFEQGSTAAGISLRGNF